MTIQATAPLLVVIGVLFGILYLARRDWIRRRRHAMVAEVYRQDLLNLVGLVRRLATDISRTGPEKLLTETIRLGYAAGAVLYTRSESGVLETRSTVGQSQTGAAPDHEQIMQQAVETGQTYQDELSGRMFVPMLETGEVVALVEFFGVNSRSDEEGGRVQSAFLEGAVELAGVSLNTQRTIDRQVALSVTDGLTGLYNHRHFQQLLSVTVAQSYLQAAPLTLVLLDIDHFKQVNDTHGHLFGDLVLREIAHTVRRHTPPSASAARYGGEEFAVALPGVEAEEGVEFAEKLRRVVAEYGILNYQSGGHLHVTVSLGVAAYQLGQGKSRLIARADEALYASKRAGRNRVTLAPLDSIN